MSKSYLGRPPKVGAPTPPRKRAFLYCRISEDREGRRLGVDRQEADGDRLADRLDMDIVGVFIENDTGASTRSKKPRPKFEQMMRLAAEGAADAILASTSARLTRRPMESERLITLYEQHGVVTHYANAADNDLSTARGRSRQRADAARDAEEAEEIGERVELDVLRRARAGLPHGGHRPFGWLPTGELHPYESPILKDMTFRALAGESLRSLRRFLWDNAVPGARWHPPLVVRQWAETSIRQMLLNPRIAGLRVHKGEVVGKATWQPLVDEATWRQVVTLFSDPGRATGGSNGRVYLLVGGARCAECDRTVTVNIVRAKNKPKRFQYECESCGLYRALLPIDTYVTAAVVEILRHYHDDPAKTDPELLAGISRLRERIQETKATFTGDDTLSPQELREMLRGLRAQLQVQEAKLARTRRGHIVEGVTGPRAAAAWDSLHLDRKQAIINALVEVRIRRAPAGYRVFDEESVEILRKD